MRRARVGVDQNFRRPTDPAEAAASIAAAIGERADVGVFARFVCAQQIDDRLFESLHIVGLVEADELHGIPEAVHVLVETEDVELVVVGVPVGADALEDGPDS